MYIYILYLCAYLRFYTDLYAASIMSFVFVNLFMFLFPSAFVNVFRDWYFSMLSGMDPLSAALILLRGFKNNRWTWDTCIIVIAHVEVCTDDLNKIDFLVLRSKIMFWGRGF